MHQVKFVMKNLGSNLIVESISQEKHDNLIGMCGRGACLRCIVILTMHSKQKTKTVQHLIVVNFLPSLHLRRHALRQSDGKHVEESLASEEVFWVSNSLWNCDKLLRILSQDSVHETLLTDEKICILDLNQTRQSSVVIPGDSKTMKRFHE